MARPHNASRACKSSMSTQDMLPRTYTLLNIPAFHAAIALSLQRNLHAVIHEGLIRHLSAILTDVYRILDQATHAHSRHQ